MRCSSGFPPAGGWRRLRDALEAGRCSSGEGLPLISLLWSGLVLLLLGSAWLALAPRAGRLGRSPAEGVERAVSGYSNDAAAHPLATSRYNRGSFLGKTQECKRPSTGSTAGSGAPPSFYLCLIVGLYFSIRTRFMQVRHIGEMVRAMFRGKSSAAGVSSFQALTIALSGRVGTGNIAGVATAIGFGGPGAVFWMWMVAFLGAATAYVESALGQIYKTEHHGLYRGGPAYYIEKGLGWRVYAIVFAVATVFACGVLLPGVQTNSIAASMENAFGVAPAVTGTIIVILLGLIIFGGVRRIAQVTQVVVPFMALGYILAAAVVVALNVDKVPEVIRLILSSAVGLDAGFGAMIGLAIQWGVKRGVYSNEAGQGTGPHAAALPKCRTRLRKASCRPSRCMWIPSSCARRPPSWC